MKTDSGDRSAYLHMLWGAVAFAAMGAFGHAAGERCSWPFVAVARTVVACVIAFAVARTTRVKLVFWRPKMLWMRSIGGSIGLICNFYAITHLPVSDALTIYNTTPIWVTLFGWMFLKMETNAATWIAVLLGVIGIALIQQPHFQSNWFAGVIALHGAIFTSIAMLGLNRLRGIDPRAVVMHFSAVSSLMTILFLAFTKDTGQISELKSGVTLLLLVMTGVSGVIGQWAMTMAFAKGHAARVSVIALTQIIFALICDVVIWHRSINFLTLVGMSLVIVPTGWLLLNNPARREIIETEAEAG